MDLQGGVGLMASEMHQWRMPAPARNYRWTADYGVIEVHTECQLGSNGFEETFTPTIHVKCDATLDAERLEEFVAVCRKALTASERLLDEAMSGEERNASTD